MKTVFKTLLAAAMISGAASLPAQAQDMFDSGDMRPHFGVRLSLDVTGAAGNIEDFYDLQGIPNVLNNGFGFTAMAVYNLPLYKNLYFEPGVGIFYNTVGISGDHYSKADPDVANPDSPLFVADYAVNGSVRNWGYRIPLLVGYHFDFTDMMRVSVFTGPQINFGFYMKQVYDKHYIRNGVPDSDHVSQKLYGHGCDRFDIQWAFGAAFHYGRYMVGLSGGIGMTNVLSDKFDGYKARRNTFSITVGYDF